MKLTSGRWAQNARLQLMRGVGADRGVSDAAKPACGHMIRTLVDLAAGGERVLAVVGASHVIRQEPALGKALEKALNSGLP
jgi:hypothetical protein